MPYVFLSSALAVTISSGIFAVYEHRPLLWLMSAGSFYLVVVRFRIARKQNEKEVENVKP